MLRFEHEIKVRIGGFSICIILGAQVSSRKPINGSKKLRQELRLPPPTSSPLAPSSDKFERYCKYFASDTLILSSVQPNILLFSFARYMSS